MTPSLIVKLVFLAAVILIILYIRNAGKKKDNNPKS